MAKAESMGWKRSEERPQSVWTHCVKSTQLSTQKDNVVTALQLS